MRIQITDSLDEPTAYQVRSLYAGRGLPAPAELSEQTPDTFYALYYIEETPVSFLMAFCPGNDLCEICGLTRADHERQGFFSALLEAAAVKIKGRQCGQIRLCFPADSSSGAAFAEKNGLRLVHTEYELALSAGSFKGCAGNAKVTARRVRLKRCRRWRAKRLAAAIFGPDQPVFTESGCGMSGSYIIKYGLRTAGIMNILMQDENSACCLYGFGILPGLRRRGIARAALKELTAMLPPGACITLTVSGENIPALNLYRSSGFSDIFSVSFYGK